MELIDKLRKSSIAEHLKCVPNMHLLALSALSLLLLLIFILPSQNAQASRQTSELMLPSDILSFDDGAVHSTDKDVYGTNAADTVEKYLSDTRYIEPTRAKTSIKRLSITNGDTLSSLFSKANLDQRDMMNFLAAAEESKRLESIKAGHDLVFEIAADVDSYPNPIVSLTYVKNKLSKYVYTKNGGNPDEGASTYAFVKVERTPDIKHASRSGQITSSLYSAGLAAGMDESLIMELAEIFGWDIDFALDIRKGDRFRILYEERFLDGEKLGNGDILSAEFVNQNESFKAVRYLSDKGRKEYYTPDGKNLRKAFLRAPVDFRRISDGFNPRRLHPITKTVRPHRGIDYAARTGTPIWSAGDGRVITASYSKYNGNYVVIQHGNNIQTKYLHLHKRRVKRGQRVNQKQIIGTVGSTGLANGPHLHYEFLLNGIHRNPRTIVNKLPKAESIPSSEKGKFIEQTSPLIAELEKDTEQRSRLALEDSEISHSAL